MTLNAGAALVWLSKLQPFNMTRFKHKQQQQWMVRRRRRKETSQCKFPSNTDRLTEAASWLALYGQWQWTCSGSRWFQASALCGANWAWWRQQCVTRLTKTKSPKLFPTDFTSLPLLHHPLSTSPRSVLCCPRLRSLSSFHFHCLQKPAFDPLIKPCVASCVPPLSNYAARQLKEVSLARHVSLSHSLTNILTTPLHPCLSSPQRYAFVWACECPCG